MERKQVWMSDLARNQHIETPAILGGGPYAVVRHPMYAGALLMLFATPLALGSWLGLVMFIPMTCVVVLRLQDEERFLQKSLPRYTEYCRTIRFRLLPHIW
jgi:protein-S-isoprenylcysteine O-methyltransferase Ste14